MIVGEHQNAMLGQAVSNVSISPTVLSCSMGNKHQRPDGGKHTLLIGEVISKEFNKAGSDSF